MLTSSLRHCTYFTLYIIIHLTIKIINNLVFLCYYKIPTITYYILQIQYIQIKNSINQIYSYYFQINLVWEVKYDLRRLKHHFFITNCHNMI